jgi:hypothetical protein
VKEAPVDFVGLAGLESIVVVGPVQAASTIGLESLRGLGLASEKSVALSLLSSPSSSRVGQPGAIVRRSAIPSGIPSGSAGEPEAEGVVPAKSPQETQSIDPAQQAAPPAAAMPMPETARSGVTPKALCTPLSPIRIVCWLAALATSAGKVKVPVTVPAAS